jgi:hypothetical protein
LNGSPSTGFPSGICRFFAGRLAALQAAGIGRDRLIIDPGLGYFLGSTPGPSLTALAGIRRPFAEYARDRRGLRADVITELDPARDWRAPGAGNRACNGEVTFHNPSGHTPEAVVATLPMAVFDRFAARRGIAL